MKKKSVIKKKAAAKPAPVEEAPAEAPATAPAAEAATQTEESQQLTAE